MAVWAVPQRIAYLCIYVCIDTEAKLCIAHEVHLSTVTVGERDVKDGLRDYAEAGEVCREGQSAATFRTARSRGHTNYRNDVDVRIHRKYIPVVERDRGDGLAVL